MKLISPYKFRERQLLLGGGGAGKTTAALSQIQSAAVGEMWVVENDYSSAWDRAIELDFPDVEDRVHVSLVAPEWEDVASAIERVVADKAANQPDNWLVIDSISPSWEYVQSWYTEKAYGADIGTFMANLRHECANNKEYAAALNEAMNWSAIKKEYARIYRAIQAGSWNGHLILTAEAKSMAGERNAEVSKIYGSVGMKPVGEGRLHHVTSSTFFMQETASGYKFSTCKDRNRTKVQNERVEALADGGFAMSYLREIAGWGIQRKAKVAT